MKTNSISENASYLKQQEEVTKRAQEFYGKDRKVVLDKLSEPVIWATSSEDMLRVTQSLLNDAVFKIDYLSDLTAYDNVDKKDGEGRFVLVYQLYSTVTRVRVRMKLLLSETQMPKTLTGVYPGANWLEREVFDMYGIHFEGHPNLRRIMMDERFTGHPLRKEYPMKQREPFASNVPHQFESKQHH